MYIPKHFQITDDQEAIGFIKRYSFGTLVTIENELPLATHIPFVVDQHNGKLLLTSHIALANPQCKTLTKGKVLAIFTEPHAYISPSHYEKEQSVPTWNYIAVHAYGSVDIIDTPDAKLAMLKNMVAFYNDEAYLKQWDTLPVDYKTKMANGIVAFDLVVDDLQGKKKLSQNRSPKEKQSIIDSLSQSADTAQKDIAAQMRIIDQPNKSANTPSFSE